jgi:putative PIN family toxin of toxin-antitoxin system
MKIVIDTNCLLQVLPQKSPYRCLWDAFLRGNFELCYTTEMLQEYEEILSRFYYLKITEYAIGTLVKSKHSIPITPYYKWNLITADPDDNKFADCALNAGADYIVTNDKHFNVLKALDFPPIKVINIETFKSILMLQ